MQSCIALQGSHQLLSLGIEPMTLALQAPALGCLNSRKAYRRSQTFIIQLFLM